MLRQDGGPVSAIVAKIKTIVQQKYFVVGENYNNRVDDLEKELEKIYDIAQKTGYMIDPQTINTTPARLLLQIKSFLIWRNPPEFNLNET